MIRYLLVMLVTTFPLLSMAEDATYLFKTYPKFCKHGLNEQPTKEFSVFVFCDDALGSNIGVILTRSGVGPAEGVPPYKWGTNRRFWQSGPWVTDVTSFVWAPSGKFLYVATSSIYGDGGLFELDLFRQEWKRIIPGLSKPKVKKQFKNSHYTMIEKIDTKSESISVGIYEYSGTRDKRISLEEIKMK